MPRAGGSSDGWGRAIERELLDPALVEAARGHGAEVLQPCTVERLQGPAGEYTAQIANLAERTPIELRARTVIAAHGSWEHGGLVSQPARRAPRACDLFGFKAHFTASSLEPGLMPLIVFPGGYGGMVHSGRGRVSFSCCIRRDALAACRRARPGLAAGEAVIAHVMAASRGVARSLAGASLAAPWLSAGPIRPGIRPRAQAGLFTIGNAAGEAHPLVAEGISMAMQSAWLLGQALLASRESAARDYPAAWRRHFAARVYASSFFAAVTTTPRAAAVSVALMKHVPSMLTWGARWSGKAHTLRLEMP
jgi:flavin-dependent dehydrogenase